MKNSYIVILNAKVYTMNENDEIKEAIVIKDSKIVYVGENIKAKEYITYAKQVINLEGKIVLPGFIDSHIHPPGTALTELYEVSLYELNNLKDYKDKIREFINNNKDIDIVYGKGWSLGNFEGEELSKGPKKEHLDEISKDIPIVLRSYDGHTIWLNSKAFERFNITKDTQAPECGKIEINDETKELWGTLKEAATYIIKEQNYSANQYKKAYDIFQKKMHKYGITSILSISGLKWELNPNDYSKIYEQLDKENNLKIRVSNAVTVFPDDDIKVQIENIKNIRANYNSRYFKTTTVKILGDGVVEGSTANLLLPYEKYCGKGEKYFGEFLWETKKLIEVIKLSNENKFSVHVHSIGDASTKKVLDAMEVLYKDKDGINFRNTITHLQLVDKKDIKRFKELDVIASVQPYWHLKAPIWWDVVEHKLLGERAEYEYPLNSFLKENVIIASSSDHSVTLEPNPLQAIECGVTRNLFDANYYKIDDIDDMDDERYLLNKKERISVYDMVKSFTINGAYAIFREDEVGSIEVGKYADIIVVDKDIFNMKPIDIEKAKVLMTFFDGELVYNNIL